ncbi:hypothetical protein MMC26_004411 [Xylographa opegraphella]|nr:hypothetical protein [Xylographa opegraphella]
MYLERLLIVQAFDPATLVLSLAWHPSPKRATEVAVSLSDGNVALLDYAKNPSIQVVKEVHALEAWTVSWSSLSSLSDECVLYSGGDDSGLRTFLPEQLRSDVACNDGDTESASSAIAPLFNTKIHSAGVTAILSLKLAGHSTQETVLTGSYDEYIRVLAPSPKGVWKVLAERRLGGGVWRLKQIPGLEKSGMSSPTQSTFHILASCMHAGARVLQICRTDHDTWSINVLYKFEEHESMNYGSDVTILQDQDEGKNPLIMVVSTSFYDRRLCLWMIPSFSNISNTSDITLKSIT